MKIIIAEDRCIGAGACVLAADEVFDQREDDGVAVLLDADPGEDQRARVTDAAARCPAMAIEVQ